MRSQLNVPAPGKIETRVSATDRPRDLHVRAELCLGHCITTLGQFINPMRLRFDDYILYL